METLRDQTKHFLLFSLQVLGPRLMENRKPFHLQNTLIVYNFSQVIFSAWLFYEVSLSKKFYQHFYRQSNINLSRASIVRNTDNSVFLLRDRINLLRYISSNIFFIFCSFFFCLNIMNFSGQIFKFYIL